MQTDETNTAIGTTRVKRPIRRDILRASLLFALVLCILLGVLSYFVFSGNHYRQYKQHLSEVITLVEHHIDADDLRDCMERGQPSEKYDVLQEFLNGAVDDLGLTYLYIVVPEETIMVNAISATSAAEFAAGEDNMPILETSDAYSREELARYRAFWDSEDIGFFEESSEWGTYYTAVKPLRDSSGRTVALICADEDISEVRWGLWSTVLFTVGLVIAAFVVFLILMRFWLRKRVTGPLMALERSTEDFAVKSRDARELSQMQYTLPEIRTGNELQSLAESFGRMAEDMRQRAEEIVGAQRRAETAEEENRRLAAEAASAAKIAALTASMQSLFANIPGLVFSKDAETRKYLACNQNFAEYAHRATPEDVVGLTDAEIFDPATAQHFTDDDKKALTMSGAYVFYEDVPDAAGFPRHFQTTKLKFTDADGRLCILGICADVTELMRMRRETEEARLALEEAHSSSVTYSHIAQALAADYSYLYYVDVKTDLYIAYRTDAANSALAVETRDADFFNAARRNSQVLLHPDDRAMFLDSFTKKNILDSLAEHGAYTLTYRQLVDGEPVYMNMKITRMGGDDDHIIIGVSNVDAQMRYQEAVERVKKERITYARITALSGDFIAVYTVDPETERYMQYSSTQEYEDLGLTQQGEQFFDRARKEALKAIIPEDLDRFDSMFTKKNVLREIEENGVFALTYRLMLDGVPTYVTTKAAIVQEADGPQLIVGVSNVDAQIRREQEYEHNLTVARTRANADALTGVRNKHAYNDAEAELNRRLTVDGDTEFAIVSLDVNDLKRMNDTKGHAAGDQLLKDACELICRIFAHSPVFRVGGDEFVVISRGRDYRHIESLIAELKRSNEINEPIGGVVVACGYARCEGDTDVAAVFERADRNMYAYKSTLKGGRD